MGHLYVIIICHSRDDPWSTILHLPERPCACWGKSLVKLDSPCSLPPTQIIYFHFSYVQVLFRQHHRHIQCLWLRNNHAKHTADRPECNFALVCSVPLGLRCGAWARGSMWDTCRPASQRSPAAQASPLSPARSDPRKCYRSCLQEEKGVEMNKSVSLGTCIKSRLAVIKYETSSNKSMYISTGSNFTFTRSISARDIKRLNL